MGMMFCRGCGKEVHDSALLCPHCGAPQGDMAVSSKFNSPRWASITAFVCGLISFLLVLDEPDGRWNHDAIIGGLFVGAIPTTFGAIAILGKQSPQWMAISGLILGVFVILITIGSK